MTPPNQRRPGSIHGHATPTDNRTISDDAVPDDHDDPVTGVHGEPLERMEKRLRNQNITLDKIRDDIGKHQMSDEKMFTSVNAAVDKLAGKHDGLASDVGEIKVTVGHMTGKLDTLVQINAQQAAATLAQAEATRRAVEQAEAAAREDKRLALTVSAEREKLAMTEKSSRSKLVIQTLGAVLIAGITALLTYLAAGAK